MSASAPELLPGGHTGSTHLLDRHPLLLATLIILELHIRISAVTGSNGMGYTMYYTLQMGHLGCTLHDR
jgi:hypothetical protein